MEVDRGVGGAVREVWYAFIVELVLADCRLVILLMLDFFRLDQDGSDQGDKFEGQDRRGRQEEIQGQVGAGSRGGSSRSGLGACSSSRGRQGGDRGYLGIAGKGLFSFGVGSGFCVRVRVRVKIGVKVFVKMGQY